jgi:hypothetical protein
MGIVSIVPEETLAAGLFRYAALRRITSAW